MMESKQHRQRESKERARPAGVFQIKKTASGKVLLGSSVDLEGPLNGDKFMLRSGHPANLAPQVDEGEFGADRSVFDILQKVKITDDPNFCVQDELTFLEHVWIKVLEPFGENGYSTDIDTCEE